MLHIILLILKIIGWILLAVLGLIVLLICVTLFVPLRYRADAICKGTIDSLYGRIRFSWLLHLVSGHAVYDGGKLDWTVRIAWKKIRAEEEVTLSAEEDFPYEEEETGKTNTEKVNTEKTETEKTIVSNDKILEKTLPVETDADKGKDDIRRLEMPQQKDGKAEKAQRKEEQTGPFDKMAGLCQRIYQKLTAFYEKIKYTFDKICDTIKSLLEKKDKLTGFITDEVHKSAFFTLLAEVKRLLRFLKPKKLEAKIHFGFDDPSVTGKVLAAVSMAYPFIGEHADIEPDFEQQVLEGNLLAAGRIRVLYAVIMFWNLVWNKNVRTTFKHIRKFEL